MSHDDAKGAADELIGRWTQPGRSAADLVIALVMALARPALRMRHAGVVDPILTGYCLELAPIAALASYTNSETGSRLWKGLHRKWSVRLKAGYSQSLAAELVEEFDAIAAVANRVVQAEDSNPGLRKTARSITEAAERVAAAGRSFKGRPRTSA